MRMLWSCAVGAFLVAGGLGCRLGPVARAERAVAGALISLEEERRLGEQLHAELEREGLRYVEDPVVERYVQDIAAPILLRATRDYRSAIHVHVVDRPDEVNAFATPGGHLYVESGLLLSITSDAQLAGVIAHEAGHVVGRHAARNMVQALGLSAVAALALGQNPSALEQVVAQMLATGAFLHHSRAQEIEADEYGVSYASQAGYDPRGLIGFLELLMRQRGSPPRALAWLSTHPADAERIENLEGYIRERNLAGGAAQTGRLPEIQRRLQATLSRTST